MTDQVSDWRDYEKCVFKYLQISYEHADVEHNVSITGHLSGIPRQVDILLKEDLHGRVFTTAFEAKHYNRNVDIKGVEEAIGLFRDLGVDRGVMITTKGYSEGALRRANSDDVDVELDILNLADLKPFQTDDGALPYSGNSGAILPAPFGWIIDGTKSPWGPARLYRRGISFEEAHQEPEFMYLQFWEKNEIASTIEELIQVQNEGILHSFPNSTIEVEIVELSINRKAILRTAKNAYQSLEITGAVEFDNFILFIVLHCRELVASRNRRKLEYLLRKVTPLSVGYGNAIDT